MADAFETARRLSKENGWSVIPIDPGTKRPAVEWRKYQTERSRAPEWLEWFQDRGWTTGVVCGQVSGVAVLDIDSPEGYAWWAERVGEEVLEAAAFQHTPKVTQKGMDTRLGHYWWRLGEGQGCKSRAMHNDDRFEGVEWDLRGDGNQVLVEPAPGYVWVRPWSPGTPLLPETIVAASRTGAGRRTPRGGRDGAGGEVVALGTMASLWANPGIGGRNNWVCQLLGHYAKHFRYMEDMFHVEAERVWAVAEGLEGDHPYERDEFDRTVESIWNAEHGKLDRDPITGLAVAQARNDNGYLIGTGTTLRVQCRYKDADGEYLVTMQDWADFDAQALGTVDDEVAERVHDVLIKTASRPEGRRALLPNSVLSDYRKLVAWLGQYDCGIAPPDTLWPRAIPPNERLRRYLKEQDPPHFRVVPALGWSDEGFICHEGVITAEGLGGFGKKRPDPKLVNWAPYRYGFENEPGEAVGVLREVLTYHDEQVCAVFGAWWAACLLKPQMQQYSSLFPFMALEAASESGKSTGFFALMLQLAGNVQGQTLATRAAMRDFVSAHKSGIVWIDDADDIEHLTELLRAATGEGHMTKKAEDRTSQMNVTLVAPICLSGESLGLGDQKALLDRAVQLRVPSPTKRRSLRDESKLQWADIVELQQRYAPRGGLSCLAGSVVQQVLARAEVAAQVPLYTTGGRHGDKLAVLRVGARILADVVGDAQGAAIVRHVDEWAAQQEDPGSENTLTLKLIPTALRMQGFPKAPMKGESRVAATPAWIDRYGYVWFSVPHLAEWWSWLRSGKVVQRTETEGALLDQARSLGQLERKRYNLSRDRNVKAMYWCLPIEISQAVIERAQGGSEGGQGEIVPQIVPRPEAQQQSLGVVERPLDFVVRWVDEDA